MRLLVVEDSAKTAAYLKKGLSEQGFVVDIAHEGQEGEYLAKNTQYDLIILDVMLPKMDGWTVLTHIREQGVTTPVLYLSARDATQDRVKGLQLGADDYLVKPFAFSELLARVQNILRRGQPVTSEVLRIADLEIDMIRHKAARGGKRLDLTPKEFTLLLLLLRRRGEVVSKTIIAEQVWDMNFDSDTNVVEVAVRRLRAKLDDPFEKKLIHTIRGVGYVLEDREADTHA